MTSNIGESPSPVDLTVAAVLAGSAAASAAVPDADGGPAALAWRWVVGTDSLSLYAIDGSSPDWRETCLGAGGALHRARVALAAEGYASNVVPLPNSDQPAHLARLATSGTIEVTPEAVALYDATEPEVWSGDAPDAPDGATSAVALPTSRGDRTRRRNRTVAREVAAAARAEGVRLRIVHDGGELAGVLHGPDTREAWLRAGAALSAVRLTARRHGLVTTTTAASEGPGSGARSVRRRISDREGWLGVGIGTPYVRLRLRPVGD